MLLHSQPSELIKKYMSQLFNTILNEVCLDERVSDGIFRMDEAEHMNALRDQFVHRGLALEDAINLTNKMLEGKYPERQAYNKDGILVTFPTPKHKARAIHARTHFEEEDAIRMGFLQKPEPTEPRSAPAEEKPKNPIFPPSEPKANPEVNPEASPVKQGDNLLAIEPPRGEDKVETPPIPPQSPVEPIKTPEAKEAEKSVVVQLMKGDDTSVQSVIHPPIHEGETQLTERQMQVLEIYKIAKEKNYKRVTEILEPYVVNKGQ